MWAILNKLFGKRTRSFLSDKVEKEIIDTQEKIYNYYTDFQTKVKLFDKLKGVVITVKARVYNFETQQHKKIDSDNAKELQKIVDEALEELVNELAKIKKITTAQVVLEQKQVRYSIAIIPFIEEELKKEQSTKSMQYLESLKKFFLREKDDVYGILHILAAQLQLLEDIENAKEEIKKEISSLNGAEQHIAKLRKTLRILEMEVLRFGWYCKEEADIIKPSAEYVRQLDITYSTLRKLGLVYSEKSLTPYNIGMITTKINGKDCYGTKGIGIIHDDNSVELRFVKGRLERHAEVVQMLFQGLPGMKLADDAVVKAYLQGLPLDKITKVAGYELQLRFDEARELKIININYASTILEIQIERRTNHIRGEFLAITKKDFDRLNYTLLFSINKELLKKNVFEMTIQQEGNKIVVSDKRIYPLQGS